MEHRLWNRIVSDLSDLQAASSRKIYKDNGTVRLHPSAVVPVHSSAVGVREKRAKGWLSHLALPILTRGVWLMVFACAKLLNEVTVILDILRSFS